MIIGCGIDLVDVSRFQRVVKRQGRHFLSRIFTPVELHYCRDKKMSAEHLAARFAAKEAVAKAFGEREGLTMRWRDVSIDRAASGQPSIALTGEAKLLQKRRRVVKIHLSLTHTSEYASAVVILEGK